MKIKINIRGWLFTIIYALVTLANITGFGLIENVPPLYQWSFYVIAIWYMWIMYKTLGKSARSHSILVRNMCVLVGIFLIVLMGLFSAENGMPLQLFTFLACILFLQVSTQIRFYEREAKVFLLIGAIGAVAFAWSFLTLADTKYWYGTAFTIEGFNPQSVGCWACVYGMVIVLVLDYCCVSKIIKVVLLLLEGYLFYITLATDTRTAIIVLFSFLLLRCLPTIKVLTKQWVSFIVAGIPALIAIVSIAVFKNKILISTNGSSLLDGREALWIDYFAKAWQHPFWGNYTNNGQGEYTHNLFVEHAFCYGYIFAIFFIVLTGIALSKTVLQIRTRKQYNAYIAFVGMLFLSSQENMAFSTGSGGMFVYAYAFLFIAIGHRTAEEYSKVNIDNPTKKEKNNEDN